MNAKELCAKLILKSLKNLSEEEEEFVFDYLYDLGYDLDADTSHQKLCSILLEATMKKDLGRQVPMTAYANSLIQKAKDLELVKESEGKRRALEAMRSKRRTELLGRVRDLPGCDVNDEDFITKNIMIFMRNDQVGYDVADGIHRSAISVSENIYKSIFMKLQSPVVELVTTKGHRAYARITDYHQASDTTIFMSQLTAEILELKGSNTSGFLKLCNSLPELAMAKFTYYGTQGELDADLPFLLERLPHVINGFSYMSLGLLFYVRMDEKTPQERIITIRVDSLISAEGEEVFAGLIKFAEADLPFDIIPDL